MQRLRRSYDFADERAFGREIFGEPGRKENAGRRGIAGGF